MPACKVCGHWFVKVKPHEELCEKCDCALYRLSGYVAPVVHGQWEPGNPICPVCGEDKFKDLDADIWCDWLPPFCPNCGAKMDLINYEEMQ